MPRQTVYLTPPSGKKDQATFVKIKPTSDIAACPIGGEYWNNVMYVGTSSLGYGVNKEFDQFWQYKP